MDNCLLTTNWRALDNLISDMWMYLESDDRDAELVKRLVEVLEVIVYSHIYKKS